MPPIESPGESALGAFIESALGARDQGMDISECRSPVKLLGGGPFGVRFWRNRGGGRGMLTSTYDGYPSIRVDFVAWADRYIFGGTDGGPCAFFNGHTWEVVLTEGVERNVSAIREIGGTLYASIDISGSNDSRLAEWDGTQFVFIEPTPPVGRGRIRVLTDSGSPGFMTDQETVFRGGWDATAGNLYPNQDQSIGSGQALNQGFTDAPMPATAIGAIVASTAAPGFWFHRFGSMNGRTEFPTIVSQIEPWRGNVATGSIYQNGADYDDDAINRLLLWDGAAFTVELDTLAAAVTAVKPMEDWLMLSTGIAYAKGCSVQDGVVTAGPGTGSGTNTYTITVDGSSVDYVAAEGTSATTIAINLVSQANKLDVATFVGLHFEATGGGTVRVASVTTSRVFTISFTVSGTGLGAVTDFAAAADELLSHGAGDGFFMWDLGSDLCEPELSEVAATQEVAVGGVYSYAVGIESGEPPDAWRLVPGEASFNGAEQWEGNIVSHPSTPGLTTWTLVVDGIATSVPNETTPAATRAALRDAANLVLTNQVVSLVSGGLAVTSVAPHATFECWLTVTGSTARTWEQFERVLQINPAPPAGLTLSATGVLSWPASNKTNGSNPQSARVYAANAGGLDALEVPITVVSDTPLIAALPNDTHDAASGNYTVDVVLTQARGPWEGIKTWALTAGPPGASVQLDSDDVTGENPRIFVPMPLDAGTYPITVRGTNVVGFDEESFDLTITNQPPILAPKADETFSISADGFGIAYFGSLTLTQGAATSANLLQGPAGMAVNILGDGTEISVGWSVANGATPGVYTIEVEAVNSQGTDSETWILTLTA